MTVSAFDHPFLRGLLGDQEVGACFSVEADLRAMLDFEAALAQAQGEAGMIPVQSAKAIVGACASLEPDIEALDQSTAIDGVVVPDLVRQLRAAVGERASEHVHMGSTSQDAIDTGAAMRLAKVTDILTGRLEGIIEVLNTLQAQWGERPLMGRTRMKRALPITVADRLRNWREPLERQLARAPAVREGVAVLHLGGPVGTLGQLGENGPAVAQAMAKRLELNSPSGPRHTQRDHLAEFASWLSLVSGSLGKLGQDIALMAIDEVGEIELSGGGGSSAMAHKQNPVAAEVLVTLARFNAAQLAAMHTGLVHENERSGAAWTLEWLTLPPMCVATAAGLRHGRELLGAVVLMGTSEL